ncbi:MAG: tetratricopeptide repeat protein [Woeseia sp.]
MRPVVQLFLTMTVLLASSLDSPCAAQGADRMKSETGPTTVLGPSNLALHDGAQALLAGRAEDGVRLTLLGLETASGSREEESALSNLCAGYILLEKYVEAKKYCDLLLTRDDQSWRGFNNRAVIHLKLKQYELADKDLQRGEELRPGAHTLKVARALYMDAVHPVAPEVIIDDREADDSAGPQ